MIQSMYEGITDYLEVMKLAGVAEVKRGAKTAVKTADGRRQTAAEGATAPLGNETVAPLASAAVCRPPSAVSVPPPIDVASLDSLQVLADAVAQCTLCKELASFRTQTVFGVGNPHTDLLFLGEAPGRDEDQQGEPFVGRAGQLLTDIIVKGMKLRREDVYICNILRCRPPGNRNPMPDEAANCRPFLDRTLELIKPRFICCLGAVAAKNLLASEQTIGALRGKVWDYNGIKVVCTYHPAYLLRNPAAKKDTWEDVQLLMREMAKDA